jgi:hypothetical protein
MERSAQDANMRHEEDTSKATEVGLKGRFGRSAFSTWLSDHKPACDLRKQPKKGYEDSTTRGWKPSLRRPLSIWPILIL